MGLTAFRLSDIPLDVRLRAAKKLSRGGIEVIDDTVRPEDRLFARLADATNPFSERVKKAAEHPSPRLYWVRTEAWEQVMGRERPA